MSTTVGSMLRANYTNLFVIQDVELELKIVERLVNPIYRDRSFSPDVIVAAFCRWWSKASVAEIARIEAEIAAEAEPYAADDDVRKAADLRLYAEVTAMRERARIAPAA